MQKKSTRIISITLLIVICCSMLFLLGVGKKTLEKVATPTGFSQFTKLKKEIAKGDFYVSNLGSDTNDGSLNSPFATIQKARDTVRELKQNSGLPDKNIVIAIKAGNYSGENLQFDERDSGKEGCEIIYTSYGDGEVILNGGIKLNLNDFKAVEGEQKDRLDPKISDKIKLVDLNEYGITKEDYGKIFAKGTYNNESKYFDNYESQNTAELFVNGERMDLARYPNKDNLKVGKVIDNGYAYEAPIGVYHEEWNTAKSPRGGTYKVDNKTSKRIESWKSLDDVWVYGYFYWDWADMSSPVKAFDAKKNELSTTYCSRYGFQKGGDYHFYNVFEELDAEGEYYLDRETGLLYVYAEEDFGSTDIYLTLTTQSLINAEKVEHMQFDGLTIINGRKNGIEIEGNNVTISNCTIKNMAQNAIDIKGSNNLIKRNEVSKIGQSGIVVNGGDRETLTYGNNIVDNNGINSIGEIYQTYRPGIDIYGVGNIASHNEIYNIPHFAIRYQGNDHIIEYNNIHDAVLYSTDAGAIYSGRNFYYGCIIRYNAIYNLGSGEFKPDGIYFDDALAGQTAYGNLIVNVPKCGILIGGGRDVAVFNNLIINSPFPIQYDDRTYDGFHNKGWYNSKVAKKDSSYWKLLEEAQKLNNQWGNKYAEISIMNDNFDKPFDKNFAVNPSGAVVEKNITLSKKGKIGSISKSIFEYGKVDGNNSYKLNDIGFVNYGNGDYNLNDDLLISCNFNQIPIQKIGRY